MVRLDNFSSELPIAMYDENPFCTVLPDCFRMTHKLIVGLADSIISPTASLLSKSIESTVTDSPTWAARIARNIGPYLILRILFFAGMIFVLYQYLKKWWLVGVFGNVILIWLSGVPVRMFTATYLWTLENLGLNEFHHDLLTWHISRNSTIFLLEYDFLALLACVSIPLILTSRVFHQKSIVLLAVGLVLAITFENLAVVYLVGMVVGDFVLHRRIEAKAVIAVTVGWAVPIIFMIIWVRLSNPTVFPVVCPDDDSACLSIPELGRSMNSAFRPLIYRLVIGFLLLPFILGLALGVFLRIVKVRLNWTRELKLYTAGTIVGLLLTYCVGYFGSALPTEFGRQTLAAQILVIIFGTFWSNSGEIHRTSKALSFNREPNPD